LIEMMFDYSGGMMSGFGGGGNWLWMAAMMVVVLGVIIGLIVFAIRASAGPTSNNQAMDVLGRRLAGGEITLEDYEKTRKALQG
jgi:uncharacterized membrane protein